MVTEYVYLVIIKDAVTSLRHLFHVVQLNKCFMEEGLYRGI